MLMLGIGILALLSPFQRSYSARNGDEINENIENIEEKNNSHLFPVRHFLGKGGAKFLKEGKNLRVLKTTFWKFVEDMRS